MKVLLVTTEQTSLSLIDSVLEVLNSIKGPISFEKAPASITPTLRNENNPDAEWNELFSYCRKSREIFNVTNNDFVVLITQIQNQAAWFSYYRDRNIFVYSEGWENILNTDKKYPIAHQVIENMVQILMDAGDVTENNPYIHYNVTGCLNDFCNDEKEILFKLKIADVCTTCESRINERISVEIRGQCFEILEVIRKNIKLIKTKPTNNSPVKIHLIQDNFILPELDNLKFVFKPMGKTVYQFYLRHLKGFSFNDFCTDGNRTELSLLYSKFCRPSDLENVDKMINNLIDPNSSSFTTAKSNINTKIKSVLENKLSKYYIISGDPGEIFKINLSQELIDRSILS